MRCKTNDFKPNKWVDYIKYSQGTLIEGFTLYKNYLVRQEMFDALPRIVIHEFNTKAEHAIKIDEESYDIDLIGGFEYDTQTLRFGYSSPTTPYETYDYNMNERSKKLLKAQIIPSGHNKNDYIVKRINAPSSDGAMVPVTILYKKDTKIDGSAP